MRRALILSALLATPAKAEDPPIVVTGQQSSAKSVQTVRVTRIDDKFALAPSGRIEEALSSVPGLQQFRRSDSRSSNPTAQGTTLRGLGGNASSRTVVLLDGVPMADPFFGSVPLSAISPERLERIVVWNGGGSGAFTEGAVAGTIELTSSLPADTNRFAASALIDDRGDTEASASISAKLGAGHAMLSARRDSGPGFWTTPFAQRVPASVPARYESWSTALRAVVPIAPDAELQVRGLVYDDHRTLRFAGADSSSSGQDASVRLLLHGRWQVEALAYVQLRNFSNVVISSTSFTRTLDQYATPATGLGAKIELRPPLGKSHDLRLGVQWRRASGVTKEAAFSGVTGLLTARRQAGGAQADIGIYLQDEWTHGALSLSGGLRADHWAQSDGFFSDTSAAGAVTANNRFAARSGWQASFRTRASLKPAANLTLFAAAYSGLRLPTLNELYRPFTVFPVVTRANAALANERLLGFEGGVNWDLASGLRLGLTGFDNRVHDAIGNVTIGTNLRERRNLDAVHARGVEFSASAVLGKLHLRGALALTDAKVEASGVSSALNGLRPAQTARFSASASAIWQPREDLALSLILRHTGAQYEDDLQTDLLSAVTTIGATVQLPLARNFALVLRGENLTDAQVVTRNQAGSMDLGAPRTVWLGVKVVVR